MTLWLTRRLKKFYRHFRTEKSKLRRARELIGKSDLFDREWYLESYRDVEASGSDPLLHYLLLGWKEGRDPGPRFSTAAYLRANDDVGQAGTNPLLHYIEHGHAEGRGLPEYGVRTTNMRSPSETFGPAAPCPMFPVPRANLVRWRRGGAVEQSGPQDIYVGGLFLCTLPDRGVTAKFQAVIRRLAAISGWGTFDQEPSQPMEEPPALIDAWLVADRLRIRWRSIAGSSFVVRVVEHSALAPRVIAERLVVDPLDVTEAVPSNPLFPLLCVFTTPEGVLKSWSLVSFPSLFRGGLHYHEMLLLAGRETDVGSVPQTAVAISSRLEKRLVEIRRGLTPLISKISVDVSCGDGRELLFQPECRDWLSKIAAISVECNEHSHDAAKSYLAEAIRLHAAQGRAGGGSVLQLQCDCLPSISVLVAGGDERDDDYPLFESSLIVADEDVSKPAVLLSIDGAIQSRLPGPLPRFTGNGGLEAGGTDRPLAAIRTRYGPPPTDADILQPIGPRCVPKLDAPAAITWLTKLPPDSEQDISECLETIACQEGIVSSVIFLGLPTAATDQLARELLHGRVLVAREFEEAVRAVKTSLAGYIDPRITLHDRHTAAALVKVLREGGAATASAAVVTPERRANEWLVSALDLGEFGAGSDVGPRSVRDLSFAFWRGIWPVSLPPRHLWIARSVDLREWFRSHANDRLERAHLCSFETSASFTPLNYSSVADISLPRSGSPAVRATFLFG